MKIFYFFGKKGRCDSFSWWENFFSGHINITKKITIYGENAMHWAIQIHTKRYGFIIFTLPIKTFGKYFGSHIYFSPNGTPWASTYYKSLWGENNVKEEITAKIRKYNFGHNFNTDLNYLKLRALNEKFEWFKIDDHDLKKVS